MAISRKDDGKTLVIKHVQLRSVEDRPYSNDDKLHDREPILKAVSINTDSGSPDKTELQIGDSNNTPTGIVTAYLKNKLVEISDDLITIKDGTTEDRVLFTIKVDANNDLSVNDALVLNSSGQVKKMLIDDSMFYDAADIDSYVDGQLLFIQDVTASSEES